MTNVQVGIMQGRLTPQFGGTIQAFPADSWREEFPKAAAAGLSCIEWIYEKPNEQRNPLHNDVGIAEIKSLVEQHKVLVRSVCADYYMTQHLVRADGSGDAAIIEHLKGLIGRAGRLGVTYIVLPFVDASGLRSDEQIDGAVHVLRAAATIAHAHHVELHVECDLPPPTFRGLLDRIGDEAVRANYDIGNSASLGYHPKDELLEIGPHLGSVHVKDRKRGGVSVALGTGDADLQEAFRQIRTAGFDRWLILQTAREENLGHIDLARRNRLTVEQMWGEAA